jgi:hypothetical protein
MWEMPMASCYLVSGATVATADTGGDHLMPAAKKHPKIIYMPGDFGDRKIRREYRKAGKVVVVQERQGFEVYRPKDTAK